MLHELDTTPTRGALLSIAGFESVALEPLADVGIAFTAERQVDPVPNLLLGTALQLVRAEAGSAELHPVSDHSRQLAALAGGGAHGPNTGAVG